jgi:hypothetical protein
VAAARGVVLIRGEFASLIARNRLGENASPIDVAAVHDLTGDYTRTMSLV